MDVFITVLEDDGSCKYRCRMMLNGCVLVRNTYKCRSASVTSLLSGLALSLTVASLALADAGIHMYDVVIGSSIVSN